MSRPSVGSVETGDEFIRVQFRDPDEFEELRTPDWASDAARSVSEGAEVRTGKRAGSDAWKVEVVLVKREVGEDQAVEEAKRIVEKIES